MDTPQTLLRYAAQLLRSAGSDTDRVVAIKLEELADTFNDVIER